jgi:hypothetical protein
MKSAALAAAILGAITVPVLAQDAANPTALRLTVRPSGFEATQNEAQARQERLLRRLEKSNHMVRSICTHCGDEWKHQIYAPFNPLASLGGSTGTPEETPD